MKEESEYAFMAEQFNKLNDEERGAVLAVAEHLTGGTVDISDEELSSALNLMKETEGCVPQEEVDGDPLTPVRRKFAAVYQTAMEMAEAELAKRGLKDRQHFNFCLVIEASHEDATHVAIVDYHLLSSRMEQSLELPVRQSGRVGRSSPLGKNRSG